MGDGDGGHELGEALLELDADALGADGASAGPTPTACWRFEGVVVVVIVVLTILLAGLEYLRRSGGQGGVPQHREMVRKHCLQRPMYWDGLQAKESAYEVHVLGWAEGNRI